MSMRDVAGTYGTLHLKADGSYTYTANTAFDALQSGSNPTDVFSFTVSDGHGGNVTQNLTFNITGTDDTPVLSADTVQAVPSGWSFDSANGHYYRYVSASQITWNAANTAAGHGRRLSRNDYGCERECIRSQPCRFAQRMAWRIGRGA